MKSCCKNKPMCKCIALACFISICESLFSQKCDLVLEIKVFDLEHSTLLENVTISSNREDYIVGRSDSGTYQIMNLCSGTLEISITHPNYEVHSQVLDIDSSQDINVGLLPKVIKLNAVNVEHFLHQSESRTLSEKHLTQKQIDAFSHINISEALSTLSGVSIIRTGNEISKPIIHGVYGSRVGIVANGQRLSDQDWGADHSPSIDLNAYQEVQLLKGAATLKYGGETYGGIIVLNKERIRPVDSVYGKVILNGINNGPGGSATSRIIRSYESGFHMKLMASYKKMGDLNAPEYRLSNTATLRQNIGFSLGKSNIKGGWELSGSMYNNRIGILRASHIGNVKDLLRAIKSDRPLIENDFTFQINAPSQANKHYSLVSKWNRRFDSSIKLSLLYGLQHNHRNEFDIRRGGRSDKPALNLRLLTHNFSADFDWLPSIDWHLNVGLTWLAQDNFADPNTGVRRLIPDYNRFQTGVYASAIYLPSNHLIFEVGGRIDYDRLDVKKYYKKNFWLKRKYDQSYGSYVLREVGNQVLTNLKLDYWTVSFNSGFYTKSDDGMSLGVNYILSQRAPNVAELFSDGLHHTLATIERGNLDLVKESAHKLLVDINKKQGVFQWEVTPFLSVIQNYIYLQPIDVEFTVRGAFPVWEYLTTNTSFIGIDMDLDYSFDSRFSYESSLSYVRANDTKTKKPLVNIPPMSVNHRLVYTTISDLQIALSGHWVFKQNRPADTDFEVSLIDDGQIVSETVNLTSPTAAYHLLGLEISKKWIKNPTLAFESRLRVQNLANISYRDYLNRLRYYSDEVGRIIELQLHFDF